MGFKVSSHPCGLQGDNHCPNPAGHTICDTGQHLALQSNSKLQSNTSTFASAFIASQLHPHYPMPIIRCTLEVVPASFRNSICMSNATQPLHSWAATAVLQERQLVGLGSSASRQSDTIPWRAESSREQWHSLQTCLGMDDDKLAIPICRSDASFQVFLIQEVTNVPM